MIYILTLKTVLQITSHIYTYIHPHENVTIMLVQGVLANIVAQL